MWILLLKIAGAAFAAFGVLCAVRLLLSLLRGESVSVAVRVADETARGQLDLLLHEARYVGWGRYPIVLLLDAALLARQPLTLEELALLSRYGAQPCVLQLEKTEQEE